MEDAVRERILEHAREKFFSLGFSHVLMDEIAAGLGVSKKTIYAHFKSKEELLRQIMKRVISEVDSGVKSILREEGGDFVEALAGIWELIASKVSRFSQPFLNDLQRHAPHIWKEVERNRAQIMQGNMNRLYSKGIAEGVIRKDVNPELLMLMHSTLIQRILNPEALSELPLTASQAFESILKVIFEGILTDKARARTKNARHRRKK